MATHPHSPPGFLNSPFQTVQKGLGSFVCTWVRRPQLSSTLFEAAHQRPRTGPRCSGSWPEPGLALRPARATRGASRLDPIRPERSPFESGSGGQHQILHLPRDLLAGLRGPRGRSCQVHSVQALPPRLRTQNRTVEGATPKCPPTSWTQGPAARRRPSADDVLQHGFCPWQRPSQLVDGPVTGTAPMFDHC